MHRLLSRQGLKAAYRLARRVSWESAPGDDGEGPPVEPLLRRFLTADRWVTSSLGAEDCLPRSLALFTYLRGCGVRASHHVGVAQYPFRAHAWVEFEGEPLLDRAERVAEFAKIAELR